MRVVETVLEAEQSLFLNGRNDIWREEREENRGGYGGEYATSDVRCSRHLRLIFKGKLLSLGLLHGGRTRCPPLRLKKRYEINKPTTTKFHNIVFNLV